MSYASNFNLTEQEIALEVKRILPNVSQSNIERKIIKYLQLSGRDADFINKFEDGYCCGIATLWAFTKWLQTQPKTSISTKRDDYTWFKSVVVSIVNWDETKESLETAKRPSWLAREFEQFIAKIEYFQHMQDYIPVAQGDLSKRVAERQLVPKVHKVHKAEKVDLNESAISYYVIDENKTSPNTVKNIEQEYSIAALFTLEQLKCLLRTPGIIQEHKLIQIESRYHTVALFRDGAEYYFFDPNCSRGEVKISSSDTIAELIFSANGFNKSLLSPIGFRMFGFDKPSAYPEVKEVLTVIKPEAGSIKEYADNYSGLHIAARTNSLASLQYYLALNKQACLNEQNSNGRTALMIAASNGYLEVAQVLIAAYVAAKVSLNEKDNNNWTALMLAASKGHLKIAQALIAAHASLNEKIDNDWMALMLATSNGHLEITQALIDAKVSLNEKDNDDWTALMLAANKGHFEIVQALIDAKVSLNEKDNDDWTALMLAANKGHFEIVRALIAAHAILNKKQNAGWTALMLAASKGHLEIVQALIAAYVAAKVSLNEETNDHWTALMIAANNGHLEVVQALIAAYAVAGVSINEQNNDGCTALMLAVISKNITIVKELIKAGAPLDTENSAGKTALMLATKMQNQEMIKLLTSKAEQVSRLRQ